MEHIFRNRQHAGSLLAEEVKRVLSEDYHFAANRSIVIGLPRGGLVVGLQVALALGCPLDLLVSKKIGAPDQPELAIGAVTSDNVVVLNQELTNLMGIQAEYIEAQEKYLIQKTKALQEQWQSSAGLRENLDLRGKQVILVDDGIATGMTAIAAARSIRKRDAELVRLATPIMSWHAHYLLASECDQIIALDVLFDFAAIGQFYLDFHQVEDEEVVEVLKKAGKEDFGKKDLAIS